MTHYMYYSFDKVVDWDTAPVWRYSDGEFEGRYFRKDYSEPAVLSHSDFIWMAGYRQYPDHEVPAWARPEGEVIRRFSLDNTAFEEVLGDAKARFAAAKGGVEDGSPLAPEDPRTAFEGGGVRDGAEKTERFELAWTADQPYDDQMLTRYARWMARGADKYADRNWESFASDDALEHAKGSLLRHVFKLLAGQVDEDHAAAVWFNVAAIELIRGKR